MVLRLADLERDATPSLPSVVAPPVVLPVEVFAPPAGDTWIVGKAGAEVLHRNEGPAGARLVAIIVCARIRPALPCSCSNASERRPVV